jgi:hypothetical protein
MPAATKNRDPILLLCLVCDQPVAREHMMKVRDGGKWIGIYHRICLDIVMSDVMARIEAAGSIAPLFSAPSR